MAEEGQPEEQPKSRFLQRFIRGKPEKPTPASNFERELFRNGALRFDFDKYVREAEGDLGRKKDWYDQNPYWDARRTAESMARDYESAHQEMIWRRRFSKQIPKHWDIWYNVMYDFEKAREKGIRLSSTLIDAGISHPHHLVANEVGKGQRLDVKQMAWLFVRPDFPEWNRDAIMQAQKQMGVSEEEIREAMRVADEVREEVRKRRAGTYSLRSASRTRKLPEKTGA